jgi:hypothetical protein
VYQAKLGIKSSGQIWDVAHGQEASKLMLPYFRIAAMDSAEQLQRVDAALKVSFASIVGLFSSYAGSLLLRN